MYLRPTAVIYEKSHQNYTRHKDPPNCFFSQQAAVVVNSRSIMASERRVHGLQGTARPIRSAPGSRTATAKTVRTCCRGWERLAGLPAVLCWSLVSSCVRTLPLNRTSTSCSTHSQYAGKINVLCFEVFISVCCRTELATHRRIAKRVKVTLPWRTERRDHGVHRCVDVSFIISCCPMVPVVLDRCSCHYLLAWCDCTNVFFFLMIPYCCIFHSSSTPE